MNIFDFLKSIDWSFMENVWVMLAIKLVILVIVLKVINITINFIGNNFVQKLTDRKQLKQVYTLLSTIKSVVDIFVIAIFVIEMLPKFGVDIRPILTAAGVLGIAVGFGAKRFIEDILSGIVLIFEGQILVGDIIEIDGKLGIVEKLNLKMVVLRDWDGKVYYIRNGMIDVVTNYTRDFAFAIEEVGVSYNEDVDKVMEIIENDVNKELQEGKCKEYILDNIEVWGVDKLDESSVNIKFRVKTKTMFQWKVRRELNRIVKKKFDEHNIEIPFPQRVIHTAKSN